MSSGNRHNNSEPFLHRQQINEVAEDLENTQHLYANRVVSNMNYNITPKLLPNIKQR